MSERTTTPLYKDVVTDLNNACRELMQHYSRLDFKAGYLKVFEHAFSLTLPDKMLHEMDEYIKLAEQFPLPADPNTEISADVFDTY